MAARGPGRPKFEPTDQQRENAGPGGFRDRRSAYRHAVRNFRTIPCGSIFGRNWIAAPGCQRPGGRTLFTMATNGKHIAATIFWAKTRMGYRETDRHELTGPDGGAIALNVRSLATDQIVGALATQGVADAGGAEDVDPGPLPPDPEAAAGSDPAVEGGTGTAAPRDPDDGGSAPAGGELPGIVPGVRDPGAEI